MTLEEIIGQRFGKLIVLSVDGKRALVKCDCGTEKLASKYDVRKGAIKSCGSHGCRVYDLVGSKFTMLTVASLDEERSRNNRETFWICKCDCGNEIITTTGQLNAGRTKSCGCQKRVWLSEKNSLPIETVAQNQLFTSYKRNAKLRNLDWHLSKEEFVSFLTQNCFYCGSEPIGTITKNKVTGAENYNFNGLDRQDSAEGYSIDNCVSCCKLCNHAKNNLSTLDFFNLIEKIYKLHF